MGLVVRWMPCPSPTATFTLPSLPVAVGFHAVRLTAWLRWLGFLGCSWVLGVIERSEIGGLPPLSRVSNLGFGFWVFTLARGADVLYTSTAYAGSSVVVTATSGSVLYHPMLVASMGGVLAFVWPSFGFRFQLGIWHLVRFAFLFRGFHMDNLVSICAVMLRHPVTLEDMERQGFVLYFCLPCCAPDSPDCTHYLAIVGIPGFIKSDSIFCGLAQYGMYSYQWLTYYVVRGDSSCS